MRSPPPLFFRATLAILLMIGFYVLAFSIIAVLLFILYIEVGYVHQVNFLTVKLGFFCLVGALVIFWSILPRGDYFASPGLLIDPNQHPKLFQVLNQIGQATGQRLPSEVYITNEVNAWVTNRGGVMGIGSRRVMGIGLPLMALLSTSQLRAVVAHEFGHYHSGDTKLGPWIYKTRVAIGRTIYELESAGSHLRILFQYYAKAFLRITHAVSRRQEFAADELAARTVGGRSLVEGLKIIHGNGQAFMAYFLNEVLPILQNGFLPPLLEGFRSFTSSPAIAKALSENLSQAVATLTSSYDTHPSLRERILAVQEWSQEDSQESNDSALSLLDTVDEVETRLMHFIVKRNPGQELKPIRWDEVGGKVLIPCWQAQAKPFLAVLSGLTLEKLPHLCHNPAAFSPHSDAFGNALGPEIRRTLGVQNLGSMLALSLYLNNWKLQASPGEPIRLENNGATINPFVTARDISLGLITEESWHHLSTACGIADLPLARRVVAEL